MPTVYEMALANARAELQAIRTEFDALARKKERLENFITTADQLVNANAKTVTAPSVRTSTTDSDAPLWKSIKFAINGKSNSFGVGDAISALERIGKPVLSKNRVQIVRNAIIKRPTAFRKIGPGRYAVIEEESQEAPEGAS